MYIVENYSLLEDNDLTPLHIWSDLGFWEAFLNHLKTMTNAEHGSVQCLALIRMIDAQPVETSRTRLYLIALNTDHGQQLLCMTPVCQQFGTYNEMVEFYHIPTQEYAFLLGCLSPVSDPLVRSFQDTGFRMYASLLMNRERPWQGFIYDKFAE